MPPESSVVGKLIMTHPYQPTQWWTGPQVIRQSNGYLQAFDVGAGSSPLDVLKWETNCTTAATRITLGVPCVLLTTKRSLVCLYVLMPGPAPWPLEYLRDVSAHFLSLWTLPLLCPSLMSLWRKKIPILPFQFPSRPVYSGMSWMDKFFPGPLDPCVVVSTRSSLCLHC